jgi:hypothetical protein
MGNTSLLVACPILSRTWAKLEYAKRDTRFRREKHGPTKDPANLRFGSKRPIDTKIERLIGIPCRKQNCNRAS